MNETSLQCSNDSVFGAVFHPMDANLIVTCGKSHINFWTMDGSTLTKRQGLFEVRTPLRNPFRRRDFRTDPLAACSPTRCRNTRSRSMCCAWRSRRTETPSQETPAETSTSGPKVETHSLRHPGPQHPFPQGYLDRNNEIIILMKETVAVLLVFFMHLLSNRWEQNQPAGVGGPRGRNLLHLCPERRYHGVRRREGPQGGAVGARLPEKGGDGGD